MAELKPSELEGDEFRAGELKELIEHWIQVIDGWVQELDQRMGGTAAGVDPGEVRSTPDPTPRPAPEAPPAVGAG